MHVAMRGMIIVGPLLLAATGCTDSVLFVTKTSIGLDFDTKPPAASIAYDRAEGYLGPRYDNGAVPPVYGRILSDTAVFNAKVRQIYATGPAAQIVLHDKIECDADHLRDTDNPLCPRTSQKLEGGKRLMFFGTTTSTGIKVTFSPEYQYPDSFHFGYKRKEFSFIPVGHDPINKVDRYPSVLAAIDTGALAAMDKSVPTANLMTSQFFATGAAAEQLATEPYMHDFFKDEAADAFHAYHVQKGQQASEAGRSLRCYVGVPSDKLPLVWQDANTNGLLRTEDDGASHFDTMNLLHRNAMSDATIRETKLREANKIYASDIAIVEGASPLRGEGLEKHRKKVCEIAKAS